jgi:hypothetical protein
MARLYRFGRLSCAPLAWIQSCYWKSGAPEDGFAIGRRFVLFLFSKNNFLEMKNWPEKDKKPQEHGNCAIDLQGVARVLCAKWQTAWVVKYLGG